MGINSLLIISPHDTLSKKAWSGTPYYLVNALRARFPRVCVISGLSSTFILRGVKRGLAPFRIDPLRELTTSKIINAFLSGRIQAARPDLIFSLGASHMVAALKSEKLIAHFSDATFAAMLDYNKDFSGLARRTIKQGHLQEGAALRRADLVLLPSKWAAQSAITDYGVSPEKVECVPLGANFDDWPKWRGRQRRDATLRLLFVGVNWEQKGGDIAFQVLLNLKDRGLDAELHVVGCRVPAGITDTSLHIHGYLSKSRLSEFQKLRSLYESASFFLLPTRSEAYGLVFAEASAYGLPSIARRTGGTEAVVEDEVNGVLIPASAPPDVYAEWIHRCWEDETRYEKLRASSRKRFEEHLNWDAWATRVSRRLDELYETRHGGAVRGK